MIIGPKEHNEQVSVVKWLEWQHPGVLYCAIPNGGNRNIVTASFLKAEGVKAGVPDLVILEQRGVYGALFIEMKRKHGGRLSPEQKSWKEKLEARHYKVEVCHGFDEARQAIEDYLRCERKT